METTYVIGWFLVHCLLLISNYIDFHLIDYVLVTISSSISYA
jgi:hypothetical protein